MWILWRREKFLAPVKNQISGIQPVTIPTELSLLAEKLKYIP
jgi:hypothetical protein